MEADKRMTMLLVIPAFVKWVWATYVFPCLAFVILTMLLPVLTQLLLLTRAYHNWLVYKIGRLSPRDKVMQLMDAMWFQDTDENLMIINSLWWLRGTVNVDAWRKAMDEKLLSAKDDGGQFMYPKLRSIKKTVWCRYVWSPMDELDMEDYVVLHDEEPNTQQELDTLLGHLCSIPLPQDKAQWQIILIDIGALEPGTYMCFFRVHHGLGDGDSLIRLLVNHIFDHPLDTPPKGFATQISSGSHGHLMKIAKAILTAPALQIKRVLGRFDRNSLHGPALSGQKLVACSEKIDMDYIKRIKTAVNCTINDVLVACLASAFQAYFERFECYGNITPNQIVASVPVNLRRSKPNDHTLDNYFSVVFMGLPLKESGLRATLMETKRRMDAIKQSAEPLIVWWTMSYVMACFPTWLSKLFFDMISDQCSMVLSNVPGPEEQFSVDGDPVEKCMFWVPQRSSVGMGVSFLSYNGSITMGLSADKTLLNNPRVLVTLFEQKVRELAKDLGVDEELATDLGVDDKVMLSNGVKPALSNGVKCNGVKC